MTSDIIRERGRSQRLSRRKLQVVADGGSVDPDMMAKKADKGPPKPKKSIAEMPDWWQRLKAHIDKREAETGESLGTMSENADLSSTYISNMVTQRKIPKVDAFLQVCKAVKASPAYILWGVDMTPEQAQWAQLLQRSSPQKRAALLTLAVSGQVPGAEPDDPAD